MAKPKLPRPTYRQHDTDAINATVRASIGKQGVFMDYLGEVVQERIEGATEFERGVVEGRRRMAGDLINIALSEPVEE
jgi:hypothetical protein